LVTEGLKLALDMAFDEAGLGIPFGSAQGGHSTA